MHDNLEYTLFSWSKKNAVWPWLVAVYNYAWFVGFIIAGIAYLLLMRNQEE